MAAHPIPRVRFQVLAGNEQDWSLWLESSWCSSQAPLPIWPMGQAVIFLGFPDAEIDTIGDMTVLFVFFSFNVRVRLQRCLSMIDMKQSVAPQKQLFTLEDNSLAQFIMATSSLLRKLDVLPS